MPSKKSFAPLPGRTASGRLLNGQRSSSQLGKKHPLPRFNSMAVKDGTLLEGPPGRGPFAGFETLIEQGSKASQKAQNVRFATPKRHGTEGQIVPSKNTTRHALRTEGFSKGRQVVAHLLALKRL